MHIEYTSDNRKLPQ